jgi:hypothetical protein
MEAFSLAKPSPPREKKNEKKTILLPRKSFWSSIIIPSVWLGLAFRVAEGL